MRRGLGNRKLMMILFGLFAVFGLLRVMTGNDRGSRIMDRLEQKKEQTTASETEYDQN